MNELSAQEWLDVELDDLDEDIELELFEPPASEETRDAPADSEPPPIKRRDYLKALIHLQTELIKLQTYHSEHLARFLHFLETAASRDRVLAETFGGRAGAMPPVVREWTRMVEAMRAALSTEQAELYVVTTPEQFSLNKTLRSAA